MNTETTYANGNDRPDQGSKEDSRIHSVAGRDRVLRTQNGGLRESSEGLSRGQDGGVRGQAGTERQDGSSNERAGSGVDNNNAQIAACEQYLSAFSETKNRILSVWPDVQIKVRGNVYEFELYRQVFGDSYMVSFGRTPGEAYEQAALSPTFLKDEAIFLSGKAAGVAETYAAFSRGFLTQEQRRKLEAAKLSAFYASNFTDAYLFLLKVADALLEETKCPLQLLNTLSREEVESLTGGSR